MSENDYGNMISEIREWLVRIDTNQQHQTKLLEGLTEQSSNAFSKADSAETLAKKALEKADKVRDDFETYKKDQVVGRRWAIGVSITVALAVLPMIVNFYL